MASEEIFTKGQSPDSFIMDFSQIIRRLQGLKNRDLDSEKTKVVSANKYLKDVASNATISKIDAFYIYELRDSDLYNMGSKFQAFPARFNEDKFGFVLGAEIGFEKSQLGANAWFLAISKQDILYFIPVDTLRGIQITN